MNIYRYDTVSEAINELRKRGYTIDYNKTDSPSFHPEDFEIVEVHRYEGDSDPGDEAVVYAIESKKGEKGVLVSGFGYSADSFTTKILAKLHFHENGN